MVTRLLIHGRSLLLPLLTLHILELFSIFILTIYKEAPDHKCYVGGVLPFEIEPVNLYNVKEPVSLEDIMLSDKKPLPGRTIFFHETRCHPPDSQYIINFTARHACAIESAALHNPHFQVFVLFESPTYLPDDPTNSLLDAIQSYKNVNLRQLNIWLYAEDTPLEKWVKKGDLLRSSFQSEYISDLLRFLTLYQFGGIYLDMDAIVLRSLEHIPLNYVVTNDNVALNNAVFSLEPNGNGHEIAQLFLRDIQHNYDTGLYKNNTINLNGRLMRRICGTVSVKKMQENSRRCRGLQVFNSSAFFAVPSQNRINLLGQNAVEAIMVETKNSYLIHSWNMLSNECVIKVGSIPVYRKYAKQHCPKVFEATGGYF